LKRFLETIGEFSSISIDWDNENDEVENQLDVPFKDKVVGHKILELKTNYSPKGLVPLERLLDSNDVSKKSSIQSQEKDVVKCNIGTVSNPKVVKLSKALSEEKISRYVNLMKELVDIFAWSYEDTKIIQHKIPLKMGSKNFRKKMR
jgi:hypothetical protein